MFYLSLRFLDIKDIKIRFVYYLIFRSSGIYINTKIEIFIYGTLLGYLFNN